ncbi:hypothetical protein [Noviherbaspirillum denitrificans]|nr:hypothetical protein [Noviherbaspirillum denitrificans]
MTKSRVAAAGKTRFEQAVQSLLSPALLADVAARMDRTIQCGVRHFSAVDVTVPLELAQQAARHIAEEDRVEEVELGLRPPRRSDMAVQPAPQDHL